MNINKKFVLRIYIVLAVCWSIWWLVRWNDSGDGIYQEEIIMNALVPLPLYFAVRWILNALNK